MKSFESGLFILHNKVSAELSHPVWTRKVNNKLLKEIGFKNKRSVTSPLNKA